MTANHIVQIIGKSLHQFHVWRQFVEFFLILSITVDDFRRNRIKQLFQMTQHAARKMAFSRLCLPADVKVRRRFKSYIHNVICKLNSVHYVLGYLLKRAPRKKAGKKEQIPKYKHHILYLINTTLSIIIFFVTLDSYSFSSHCSYCKHTSDPRKHSSEKTPLQLS